MLKCVKRNMVKKVKNVFTKHNSLVDVQYKNLFDQSSIHIYPSYACLIPISNYFK